jgi:leucyl-tRNA synthetase
MYTFLNKDIKKGYSPKTIKENYKKILITLLPIIPHFALECIERNKFKNFEHWPNTMKNSH